VPRLVRPLRSGRSRHDPAWLIPKKGRATSAPAHGPPRADRLSASPHVRRRTTDGGSEHQSRRSSSRLAPSLGSGCNYVRRPSDQAKTQIPIVRPRARAGSSIRGFRTLKRPKPFTNFVVPASNVMHLKTAIRNRNWKPFFCLQPSSRSYASIAQDLADASLGRGSVIAELGGVDPLRVSWICPH